MAKINSIAFGKARGKIGNVIFQSYKDKVIARQLNTTISTPPSGAQIIQRNKLKTAGMAYSYLADFLGDAVGIKKYGENMSAAFTRITQSQLPEGFTTTPIEAADALYGNIYGVAKPFHILEFNLSGSLPVIKFNNQGEEFLPHTYARMFTFNVVSGAQNSVVEEITEEQFNNGEFMYSDGFNNLGACACYIANGQHQLVSEIYFQNT